MKTELKWGICFHLSFIVLCSTDAWFKSLNQFLLKYAKIIHVQQNMGIFTQLQAESQCPWYQVSDTPLSKYDKFSIIILTVCCNITLRCQGPCTKLHSPRRIYSSTQIRYIFDPANKFDPSVIPSTITVWPHSYQDQPPVWLFILFYACNFDNWFWCSVPRDFWYVAAWKIDWTAQRKEIV